jgi:dipeptidase E
MSTLFLASEVDQVVKHFVKKINLQGETLKTIKAAFIPTAGEVEQDQEWIKPNRNGLNKAGIKTFDYTITGKTIKDLERDLGDCDLIHVNGGNTFYLLLQAKKSGFDKFIQKQVNKGVIYTGSSAGSVIAAPDIAIAGYYETKVYEKKLPNTKGFNLVDFNILPHWGSPIFRDLYENHRIMTAYKKGYKIILLNDDQYVEVHDGNYQIVDITKD